MYNQNIKIKKTFNSVFLNWDVHLHFVHKDDGNYRAAYDEYSFRQMYYCVERITELNANETTVI